MARIAVVDDDRDFTEVVAEILLVGGHEVVACNSGECALDCIINEHPDAVLLDVRFGDHFEAGWRILDQLRENPLTAHLPVIVSSAAHDDLRVRQPWLWQRGIPVLPKPFEMDDLLRLVGEVLSTDRSAASLLEA